MELISYIYENGLERRFKGIVIKIKHTNNKLFLIMRNNDI